MHISRHTVAAPLLALSLVLLAPAQAAAQTETDTAMNTPQTVTLSAGDVESFIAALTELGDLGLRLAGESNGDASGVTQMLSDMANQDAAMRILDDHGFDAPRFRDVGYSVMMAYAAGELKNSEAEIAAAKQQFAQLKGMMPDDQYRMLEKQMLGVQQAFEAQPEANVELVRRYKTQIDAATD